MFSYREWYQQNKKRLSVRRKSRYRKDPEFQKTVRLSSYERYHLRTEKRTIPDRRIVKAEEGERFFTIGRIAELIGRKALTVRCYHKTGVIPEPTHFDSRGWRLYDRTQAVTLQMAFRKFGRKELRSLREVKNYILEQGW